MVRGIFGFFATDTQKGHSHFGHIPHCHSALAHADRRENFTVEARSAEHFRDEPVSLFDFALSADELAALESGFYCMKSRSCGVCRTLM